MLRPPFGVDPDDVRELDAETRRRLIAVVLARGLRRLRSGGSVPHVPKSQNSQQIAGDSLALSAEKLLTVSGR